MYVEEFIQKHLDLFFAYQSRDHIITLWRGKDVESALFHPASYMVKYDKEHNRKGQPLTFLLPVPDLAAPYAFYI